MIRSQYKINTKGRIEKKKKKSKGKIIEKKIILTQLLRRLTSMSSGGVG